VSGLDTLLKNLPFAGQRNSSQNRIAMIGFDVFCVAVVSVVPCDMRSITIDVPDQASYVDKFEFLSKLTVHRVTPQNNGLRVKKICLEREFAPKTNMKCFFSPLRQS
jgi:hypothetical protein